MTLRAAAFDTMYSWLQVKRHEMTPNLIMAYRTTGRDQLALVCVAKM